MRLDVIARLGAGNDDGEKGKAIENPLVRTLVA